MSDDQTLGRGRHLAEPQFAADDGAADAYVRTLLAAWQDGSANPVAVVRHLRSARLLAAVVAVLDGLDEAGGDKDSHMAAVSVMNGNGQKGMLAFTGTDSLAAWNAEGRPVPALGRDLARSAIDDGAAALVVDLAGPHQVVIAGALLDALAAQVDLERVEALVQAALAPLTADGWVEITVAGIDGPEAQADVLVMVGAVGGAHPDGRLPQMLAQQAATALAARADIHRLVPGGIAVVPA